MRNSDQLTVETFNEIFFEACEDHQNGEYEAARLGYERLIEHFDEAPILHYNLGLLYLETEELEPAVDSLQKAAYLTPEDPDILFNLALCRKNLGDIGNAINIYRQVLELEPESVDALYNLAGCYRDKKDYDKAVRLYMQALDHAPDYLSAWNNLAYVQHLRGDVNAALTAYKKVLELHPDHASAAHMVDALTGARVEAPPTEYVREVFDNYSERFEQCLVGQLKYSVPTSLRSIFDDGGQWKPSFDCGVDLGCGTGLSGEVFADVVKTFVGVDLSPGMIEQARAKDIYHLLHACPIDEFLSESRSAYDFFLAADVLIYLGELETTLRLLRSRAADDALLCFSTERSNSEDYVLRLTGRFAHSAAYVKQTATSCGWELLRHRPDSLRKEKGEWIEGDLWFFAPQDGPQPR